MIAYTLAEYPLPLPRLVPVALWMLRAMVLTSVATLLVGAGTWVRAAAGHTGNHTAKAVVVAGAVTAVVSASALILFTAVVNP